MHFEMHITAFRGLLEAALCTKKQEKTKARSGEMAPPTKRGASTIAVLRAAREELERAKEVVDFDERRKAICDWARGLGYKEWDGIPNNYQRWRDGVVAKFGRQAKGLDDDGPPEGSSLRPPPPPLPSSAASNKAIRTPPAAQASSEQQPSAIRQRVLLPPSVSEERDEPIPQARPPLNKP